MQLDPKGLEAAKDVMRSGSGILIMGEAFNATMEAAINAYLEAAPSPSPSPGVVEALRDAAERFEEIRLLLVHHLHEPERSAFWKAVDGRTKCQTALASLSQPAKGEREGGGE